MALRPATGWRCWRPTAAIRSTFSSPADGLGAIFVPLNWRLAGPELQGIIGDCTPKLLVYDAEFADRALALAEACKIRAVLGTGDAFEAAAYEGPLLTRSGGDDA